MTAALLAIVSAQIFLVVYVLYLRRRQKSEQDAIVGELRAVRFWRIAVSRPEHLKKLWKINAIQALAVLIDEGEQLRLRGRWSGSRQPLDMTVPKKSARLTWDANPSPLASNLAWIRVHHPTGDLMIAADTGLNVANSKEALADLVRNAFPDHPLPSNAGVDFALEKNRRSLAVVAAFFLLLAFAALDSFVFSGYELIDAQIAGLLLDPFVLAGGFLFLFAVAMLSYRHLVAGKVPPRESMALSALLLVAATLTALPVLKRIDQALAGDLSTNYEYTVLDSVVNLAPIDKTAGLPQLRFTRAPEYWAQFPAGSEVTIPLIRGPIGLWQLDHARFDPPVFAFYDKIERK